MKKTMNIQDLKRQHQKEVNDFQGLLYAFSNDQLKEAMEEVGLEFGKDNDKILNMGSGCFILKNKVQAWDDLVSRQKQELQELRKNKKELKNDIIQTMNDCEYAYSQDDDEILERLGIDKNLIDKEFFKIYKTATKEYLKNWRG